MNSVRLSGLSEAPKAEILTKQTHVVTSLSHGHSQPQPRRGLAFQNPKLRARPASAPPRQTARPLPTRHAWLRMLGLAASGGFHWDMIKYRFMALAASDASTGAGLKESENQGAEWASKNQRTAQANFPALAGLGTRHAAPWVRGPLRK